MKEDDLLIKDYEITQAYIDKIDRFLFWIRNWTIVMCSAVIVYGVTNNHRIILPFNLLLVLVFLFLELIQKSFQEDAMQHAGELEDIIQKSMVDGKSIPKDYLFGLGHSLKKASWKGMRKILSNKSRWHIWFFYVMILLITVLAFFIEPFI